MEILEWTNFPFLGARKINVRAAGTSNRCAVMDTGRTAISLLTGQKQRFTARHTLGSFWISYNLLIPCSFPASFGTHASSSLFSGQEGCQSVPDSPASWGQFALETQQSCIPDSQWEAREKADFHIYKVSKVQMALFFFLLHWRMGKTGLCIRVSWNSEHVG